ncbi:MAG TPA: hypothetical protein VF121_08095 [Thermoanaerobaculia bacterium]|nr:hypothetical protein [Thermoanaerobaculia bacterium]
MQIQVCPRCGSEFQPHVTECLDCGTATEARWDVPGAPPAPPPPAPTDFSLPRDVEACSVRFGDLQAATELAVFLEERGVPCRVDSTQPARRRHYHVLVAPEDQERARALDREHLAAVVPEGEAVMTEPPPGHCPACGSRVPDEVLECPDCGLVVDGGPEGAESASE